MLFNYSELNEYVLYVAESLKFIDRTFRTKLESLNNQAENEDIFKKVVDKLNTTIRISLECRQLTERNSNEIKTNIFSFLIKRHEKQILIVPAPALSLDLIIHLAIQNQLEDITEVKFKIFYLWLVNEWKKFRNI